MGVRQFNENLVQSKHKTQPNGRLLASAGEQENDKVWLTTK